MQAFTLPFDKSARIVKSRLTHGTLSPVLISDSLKYYDRWICRSNYTLSDTFACVQAYMRHQKKCPMQPQLDDIVGLKKIEASEYEGSMALALEIIQRIHSRMGTYVFGAS